MLSNTTQSKASTSFSEILDKSAEMLFMTEIFRGFWLTAEVMMKPKVTINYVSLTHVVKSGGSFVRSFVFFFSGAILFINFSFLIF